LYRQGDKFHLHKEIGLLMLNRRKISFDFECRVKYGRTPFIRINWNGEPFGCAENPDAATSRTSNEF